MSTITERPAIGTLTQFLRRVDSRVIACKVVGHDDEMTTCFYIDYLLPETGELVSGAFIHVYDLVSDDDAATARPPFRIIAVLPDPANPQPGECKNDTGCGLTPRVCRPCDNCDGPGPLDDDDLCEKCRV